MSACEIINRAASAKYPNQPILHVAVKSEMFEAIVKRLERNALDALTIHAMAADIVWAWLRGPGGAYFTDEQINNIITGEHHE